MLRLDSLMKYNDKSFLYTRNVSFKGNTYEYNVRNHSAANDYTQNIAFID